MNSSLVTAEFKGVTEVERIRGIRRANHVVGL